MHEPDGPPLRSSPAESGQPVTRPSLHRCGICQRLFDFALSAHRPFCSARCQQVDLGRWLGESYGLPVAGDDEEDVGP